MFHRKENVRLCPQDLLCSESKLSRIVREDQDLKGFAELTVSAPFCFFLEVQMRDQGCSSELILYDSFIMLIVCLTRAIGSGSL